MAHRRSPPHRVPSSSIHTPLIRKKYPLRRSPPSRKRSLGTGIPPSLNRGAEAQQIRPVLVPLHPNLRRLPSRLLLAQKETDTEMHEHESGHHHYGVQVGSKRKRVASTNENAHAGGRPSRGSGRLKKAKAGPGGRLDYTSDESEASSMDIDPPRWTSRNAVVDEPEAEEDVELEDEEEDEEEEDENESTDDHLINSAQPHQLQRLRKDELVRLYTLAGLSDDCEAMTKSEITDAIVAARDDIASLPPSSPPGRGDGNSSDYSSDDGNVAENELDESEMTPRSGPSALALRRRATTNDFGRLNGRPLKGRSVSMGHLNGDVAIAHEASRSYRNAPNRALGEGSGSCAPRRRTTSRSSPSTSASTPLFQSPPATRLRSRKTSAESRTPTSATTPTSAMAKMSFGPGGRRPTGKGKGKQVEFSDDVQIKTKTPSKRSVQQAQLLEEESDLTELEDSDVELPQVEEERVLKKRKGMPSPRRLRSGDKGKAKLDHDDEDEDEEVEEMLEPRRVTPMRKAKRKMKSMREEDDVDEDEGVEGEEEDQLIEDDGEEEGSEQEEEEDEEEEEVDELVSNASTTPPRNRATRTPLKRRLRSRGKPASSAPSDGDDEEEEEEDDDEQQDEAEEEVVEEDEDGDGEGDEDDDGDEATIVVEPRRLRNGKIVGEEEDAEMDDVEEDLGEEEEDAADEEEDEAEAEEDEGIDVEDADDVDAEGDPDDEEMTDDDVDLTVATAKTLVRLRRDDLIRLCETRDLEPVGTKPQLAEALLEWRDRHVTDFSSPSSAGTVRPPSTVRRRRSSRTTPPVLLRSHFHQDEPRTPPISPNRRDPEPELELDLGTLGLEDREIPPEKLTKLEKIGSGGFKDVFIGKFKGRKIAISEFRGQLSAMDIKELKLLGGFDHPNIVRFLGVSIPEDTRATPVMIVSELCSNGDLFDYVRNVNPPTLHKVLLIMLDIAHGLQYLHLRKPSVIHRDCKSSNILITSKGTAKIADFGLAKVKQSTRSMVRSLVGTVNWQAPELWHAHPKYNHKVDVFSCALVYWEMLQWHLPNKKFPWEGMNEHAIYDIVGAKRQRPSLSGLRKQWCPEVVDLIEHMWAHEHQDRPTMSEVVDTLEALLKHR